MSDILNIRVTERELDLIMDLLHEAGHRTDADGQPAIELCHDLMEQSGRAADDWDATDLDGRTFSVSEDDFIDHGIRAREMAKTQKATSMAADRRTMRFGEFSVDSEEKPRSEIKNVDLWDANDPKNW